MSPSSSITPGIDLETGAQLLLGWVEEIDRQLDLEEPKDTESPTTEALAAVGIGTDDSPTIEGEGALHVIFELAGSAFAVPAADLAELKVFESPMPIPGVPPWVLGIETFRGETLSVTDLACFLGFSSLTRTKLARTMVVFDPRNRRTVLTGLVVDAVSTHEWLPDRGGNSDAAKGLSGRLGRFTQRIIEVKGRALAVLDLDALLRSEEFFQLST